MYLVLISFQLDFCFYLSFSFSVGRTLKIGEFALGSILALAVFGFTSFIFRGVMAFQQKEWVSYGSFIFTKTRTSQLDLTACLGNRVNSLTCLYIFDLLQIFTYWCRSSHRNFFFLWLFRLILFYKSLLYHLTDQSKLLVVKLRKDLLNIVIRDFDHVFENIVLVTLLCYHLPVQVQIVFARNAFIDCGQE